MSEADFKELKKGGMMRQAEAGLFSVRLHVVGGRLATPQLRAIREAADRFGRGEIHLTARQGVEIPHVRQDALAAVKEFLAPSGVGVGVCGPRGGNFAVQVSDLVIGLGTRLSQMITGGKQNLFAPRAKKVMVDIDGAELTKFGPESFRLDLPLDCDLKTFFAAMSLHRQIINPTALQTGGKKSNVGI